MKTTKNILAATILGLSLAGCLFSGDTYTASDIPMLVKPTHRAWVKPGSTMEDENIARKECGEELRANVELRKEITKFHQEVKDGLRKESSKKNPDPWSAAGIACMARKGFTKND